MPTLKQTALFSVVVFSILSILLFVQHELHLSERFASLPNSKSLEKRRRGRGKNVKIEKTIKEMVAILNDLKREKAEESYNDAADDGDDDGKEETEEVTDGEGRGGELQDKHESCEVWASRTPSECQSNVAYMQENCPRSCRRRGFPVPPPSKEATDAETQGDADPDTVAEAQDQEPQEGEDPGGEELEQEEGVEESENDATSESDGAEEGEAHKDDDKFETYVPGPEIDYYKNHEEDYTSSADGGQEDQEEQEQEQEQSEESLISGGSGGATDDKEPLVTIQEQDGHLSEPGGSSADEKAESEESEEGGVGGEQEEGLEEEMEEEAESYAEGGEADAEGQVGEGADDDAEKGELAKESEAEEGEVEAEAELEEVEQQIEVEPEVEVGGATESKETQAQAQVRGGADADATRGARGSLTCDGKQVDSEVIYWRKVPEDAEYESPITPHHGIHHDRYLSFEYDNGGWNNMRMGIECLAVMAHAMGRTLVIPPQQHLYLLGKTHKDKEDTKAHDEMGFEDIFETTLLAGQKGLVVMHMEDFLAKEGVTGGLHGKVPPQNSTEAWGRTLWAYLDSVADVNPQWSGRYIAFPSHAGDFELAQHKDPKVVARLKRFGGDRLPVFYDSELQRAHHIHFPGDENHRLLQHHYAFAFFADPVMQTFYKRFVRDYMRYKDSIQCAGHELVEMVRADARASVPNNQDGVYYALHVRRGDFQFKDVKISAAEMVQNLVLPNGTPLIPRGALVYLSTDDPKGICENCIARKKPCESYKIEDKPTGCPKDSSWKAFYDAGWKVRFLLDYQKKGAVKGVNPNTFGMIESIVCSRAKVFAGTYFSTFTGYIHRLRGYHGLGEATYYHSTNYRDHLQMKQSVGHGFSREWRAGWLTDDGGNI